MTIDIVSNDKAKQTEDAEKKAKMPMDQRTTVYRINRIAIFRPPKETLEKFLELYRRFQDTPTRQYVNALEGSSYVAMYTRKLMRDTLTLGRMRTMAELHKAQRSVLLVDDSDPHRPDCEIIRNIILKRINDQIW